MVGAPGRDRRAQQDAVIAGVRLEQRQHVVGPILIEKKVRESSQQVGVSRVVCECFAKMTLRLFGPAERLRNHGAHGERPVSDTKPVLTRGGNNFASHLIGRLRLPGNRE